MKRKLISAILVMSIILSFMNISIINVSATTDISIGDYIQIGIYYDEPILWRCVDIDENGPLMISDKIIDFKPYDAAGNNKSGSHSRTYSNGETRKKYGSDYWKDSNIRSWLNSTASKGNVVWACGNPPTQKNVLNGFNEYSDQEGFLSKEHFTEVELSIIKSVNQKTILNGYEYTYPNLVNNSLTYNDSIDNVLQNYKTAYGEYTTDRMFLIDINQLYNIYKNNDILGENYHLAKVTTVARYKADYSNYKGLTADGYWHYWLRTPSSMYDGGSSVRNIAASGVISSGNAWIDSIGIRPAFYIKDNCYFGNGNGTKSNPYNKPETIDNIGSSNSPYTSIDSPVYSTEQQKILNDFNIDTNELLQNISCGNHPIKGPSVTFLGKTFYLFEFDGKLNLEFKGLPISVMVDSDSKTLKFLFGFAEYDGGAYIGGTADDPTYWSQSYRQVKSMYQDITGKKVDTTRLWNQFSSVRGQLKKLKSDLIVDADCCITGYMELSYETGSIKFSEGGLLMEAGVGGEFVGRVPAFPPAYVVMGLKASIDGGISIAYEQYISIDTRLDAALAANVGVGLGTKKAKTYLEGGLIGTLGANMHVANGKFANNVTDPLIVTVKGEIYLKGSLLGFLNGEKNWPIGEPVQLYPSNNISLMSCALFDEDTIDDVIANSTPLSRDYLYDVMLMSIDDSDKLYSDKSIYSYNAPVLTTLADGSMLLLWIDDLGTKNDINKTSLMYSIYDGEAWSEVQELFETGTYNGAPVIYNDGERVHIIWSKAKTVFTDDAGLEDLITDTELNYTSYANGEFTKPVVLTENSLFEINYDIIEHNGNVAVAWSENNENDPYMTSGINSLYVREYMDGAWGEMDLIIQSNNAIDEIELYYVDDALNCAYTLVDDDNSTSVYNNLNMLSTGGYLNYYNGELYYLSNSKIMMYNVVGDTLSETALEGVNNFSIHEGNAYSLVSDGFACELYESICTDGEFSEWEQVTEFDKYIRDYSVTTNSLGEPVYALNLVAINEGENIYGASELAVCKASDINALELNAVYYDETNVAPSTSLPLNIDVTNVGTTDISGLTISITDNDGSILSSGIVNTEIASGESATIVYNYTLPSELELYDVTVTVTSDADERNLDNNSIKTSIGYADIIVQDVVVERTENGAVASGAIYNAGYSDATNVVLSIYDASYPDEVLATIECADIASGESYGFTYDIPEKYLSLEDKMTMYGLNFEAGSDSEELNYANNTEKVVFGELTDYTIAFVDGNQLLDIVSVDEFDGYSITKAGYTLEGWYTSSALDAINKIITIPADVSENLIVFAKWIPMSIDKAEYANNSISVKATVSEELLSESGIVIVALYKNNTLVSTNYSEILSIVNHKFTSLDASDDYNVKLFCWDGFENITPLCEAVSAKVK